MIFALIGNQNCGKTTLFNQMTGSNQHVGNFPGVTVDQKMGKFSVGSAEGSVVDLPGIYSLRPYTNEEIVTRDFLLKEKPDGIINIVDATNIERNLYLTLQLIEMRIPMVLALNMMDEVRNNGGSINVKEMSRLLGIPIIPISAIRNEGVEDLIHTACEVAENKQYPKVYDFCTPGPVHRCIHGLYHQLEDHASRIGMNGRFAPGEAGFPGVLKHLLVFALFPPDDRRKDDKPGSLSQGFHPVHDLVNGLAADLPAALRAVGNAHPRPQEAEIIVDFRHRSHGRTGVFRGGLLVNGNGRGQAVDGVHVRLVHLPKELAGVRA